MVESTTTQVPVKLEYEDADNGTTVIGTMFTGGPNDLINTATLKNGITPYTKLVIEGSQQLQDRMPVSKQKFAQAQNGEDEPEILVYTDNGAGWELRDRVYALDGGNVDDNGNYKNKKLYGFEKYLGNQRVEVTTPITTHIVDALEEVLPSGYVVDAPPESEISGGYPEVNDYTFKGPRQNAFQDLSVEQGTLDQKWAIIFTTEQDANGNYKVRYEPQGFGGREGNISRRDDPINYDYWRKKDASTVVSQVTAKAKDSNGNVLQVIETANNPAIDNEKTLNIDYRVGGTTELSNVAQANLQADFVEHGAFEGPLYIENTVNFSIGLFDSQLGINDEFTVVEQKDFFHQGETRFSLEFEDKANIGARVSGKKNQGQYDQLFSETETDVGSQEVDANTEDVDDQYDSHNSSTHPHDVGGKTSTTSGGASTSQTVNVSSGNFQTLANSSSTIESYDVGNANQQTAIYYISMRFEPVAPVNTGPDFQSLAPNVEIEVDDGNTTQTFPSSSGFTLYSTAVSPDGSDRWKPVHHQFTIKIPNVKNNSFERIKVEAGATGIDGLIDIQRVGEEEHSHNIQFETERAQNKSDGSTNDTNPSDSNAGDTTSLSASGSTEANININTSVEENTSR